MLKSKMEWLKCIVIGGPVCGKTSLIHTYMSGSFQGYIPDNVVTRYDVNLMCNMGVIFKDEPQVLEKYNICRDEFSSHFFKIYDYEIDKSHSSQCLNENELDEVDVIILCYQSISISSKKIVESEFRKLIGSRWPNVPVVLAACLSDLLKSNLTVFESMESLAASEIDDLTLNRLQDQKLCEIFDAKQHIYCSSLEHFNTDKVFNESFKIAVKNKIKKQLEIDNNSHDFNQIPANEVITEIENSENISSCYNESDKFHLENTKSNVEITNEKILNQEISIHQEIIENLSQIELKEIKESTILRSRRVEIKSQLVEMENQYVSVPTTLIKSVLCLRTSFKIPRIFKQVIALFGFTCFLFYLITCKYYTGKNFSNMIEMDTNILEESIQNVNKSFFSFENKI